MKNTLLTLGFVALAMQVQAQTIDTVRVEGVTRKFKPGEFIMIMFETLDTVDASGKRSLFSRSYFFDKTHRSMASVREYSNPNKPLLGTQVVYSFWQNRLTKVTVVPPKARCVDCSSEYYFANDTLLRMSEKVYHNAQPLSFVTTAHHFVSKVPGNLPWGYFNDEILSNGKKKKIHRRTY